jgi:ABC-type transport system involved in multi-copper enzyme maturation permease subunit
MTFLPVVERELRVAARRRYTYWTRFLAALSTVVLGVWIWSSLAADEPERDRGKVIFEVLSGAAFIYCLFAGIGITSDCLSEEKREGTLGLLFLTDLKGYDVVLGKLAATSLNAIYRLFSIFPLLAVPLLLGGFTLSEIGRMALVLTNTLFFSLSAGMLASAASVQERRSMLAASLLIVLVTGGPPLVGWIDAAKHAVLPSNPAWLLSSAVYPALLTADKPYKASPAYFWSAVATTHLLGWFFLALASGLVRRAWQDKAATGLGARWRERQRGWQFGHGPARSVLRARWLEINPIFWLVARDRLKPLFPYATLFVTALAWLALYLKFRSDLTDPTVYFLIAYGVHTLFKLWVAIEACRPLAEERRNGTLEVMLSTPLSIDEILAGELLALKRQFSWPVVIVLAADFLMLVGGTTERLFDTSNEWYLLFGGLMVMFVADLFALAWVGMWLGLTAPKANRAFRGTIGRVLVLPWAVFLIGATTLAMLPGLGFEPTESGLLTAALILSLLADALFINWARTNLRERFRLAATQRFQIRNELDARAHPSGEVQTSPSPALAS